MDYTCPNCGSKYKLRKIKIPLRDKDNISCDICNHVLLSWNGGEMWTSTLIEKKELHLKKDIPKT